MQFTPIGNGHGPFELGPGGPIFTITGNGGAEILVADNGPPFVSPHFVVLSFNPHGVAFTGLVQV